MYRNKIKLYLLYSRDSLLYDFKRYCVIHYMRRRYLHVFFLPGKATVMESPRDISFLIALRRSCYGIARDIITFFIFLFFPKTVLREVRNLSEILQILFKTTF